MTTLTTSVVADGQTTTVCTRDPVFVSSRRPERPSMVGSDASVIFVRLAVRALSR